MVIKEFRCDTHGDFESGLPICPVCKRKAKRVFLTAPNIGSTKFGNINRALDDILPSQHLSNYSNATGYPRPSFSNVFQNSSGFSAGWADPTNVERSMAELNRYLPAGAAPMSPVSTKLDVETGRVAHVDISQIAKALPRGIGAETGAKVGIKNVLKQKANIVEVGPEKGRHNG
jgi:hypothetical protein